MSNFRRPKHLTTRRMQETRPNPPKEHSTSPRKLILINVFCCIFYAHCI